MLGCGSKHFISWSAAVALDLPISLPVCKHTHIKNKYSYAHTAVCVFGCTSQHDTKNDAVKRKMYGTRSKREGNVTK